MNEEFLMSVMKLFLIYDSVPEQVVLDYPLHY